MVASGETRLARSTSQSLASPTSPARSSRTPGEAAAHWGDMSVPPLDPPSSSAATASLVATLRAAGCVFAEDEAHLLLAAAPTADELSVLVGRRVAGEPLELILGWAELAGARVALAPGVFVPRQRTRLLVEQAAALASAGDVVLDLCCGTGAVGLAVALAAPGVELHAADVDPDAVACARVNVEGVADPRAPHATVTPGRRQRAGTVYEGDLFEALPASLRGRVDVLVVNAPYVPTAAVALMPVEARVHEHLVALDGGSDGLEVQRRVAHEAGGWLTPGGHVLVETSERQAAATAALLAAAGLVSRVVRSDDLDATVVVASRDPRNPA